MANTYSATLARASNQHFNIADASQTGLDFSGNLTFELWVKLVGSPASGETYSFFNKNSGAGNNLAYDFSYQNNAGTLRFAWGVSTTGANFEQVFKNNTLSTGTWVHVAVAWTAATSTAEFYVDGTSIGTVAGTFTSIFDGTSPLNVGNSDATGSNVDGQIDEVRMWNVIRTGAEINANKCVQIDSATNLQASWHLDNALTDSSGNGNTLTNVNTATFTTDIPSCFSSGPKLLMTMGVGT